MVGTSSPVSSFRSRMVTRSTLMISKVTSTIVSKQPIEVELGGELLGDLEQHLQLEGLAGLARRGLTRSWPAAGPSRLVMPGGTAAHHELPDDLARRRADFGGDGRTLDRRRASRAPSSRNITLPKVTVSSARAGPSATRAPLM